MPFHAWIIQTWNKRYRILTRSWWLWREIYQQKRRRSSHHDTTKEIPNQNELERRLLSRNDTRVELSQDSQWKKRPTINTRIYKRSPHRIQTSLHQTTVLGLSIPRPNLWKKSIIHRRHWNTNIHKETNPSTATNMWKIHTLCSSNWQYNDTRT